MRIVLDSNEYINFFNKKPIFLYKIIANNDIPIYIHESIVIEVLNNINNVHKGKFYKIIFENNIILYNNKLPFYLHTKYKKLGLKKGDIAIAAFCDYINANYFISENRHFLREFKFDKFKVVTLNGFFNNIEK